MKRRYIVYKITNKLNNKIYIGCHSTINTNDRYMGSGKEIKEAIKAFGKKSFLKETLFDFDTKEEMLSKEKELVTKEFCMRSDTYNRIEGGGSYSNLGMICVKDKNENYLLVYKEDPRYLSGEFIHMNKNRKCIKGKIGVKDKNGNTFKVFNDDPRWLTGEIIPWSKGLPQHVNQSWKNKKHSEESKRKQREASLGNQNMLGKERSMETKNKISESRKGLKLSNEVKAERKRKMLSKKQLS